MKKLNKKGFTLLELLAVLVILAALATIAIPIFTNKGDQARIAAHMENLRVIADAAQRYEWDNGQPAGTDDTYYNFLDNTTAVNPIVAKGFLTSVPTSPYADTTGRTNYRYALGKTSATSATAVKLVTLGDATVANGTDNTVKNTDDRGDIMDLTTAIFKAYKSDATGISEIMSDGTIKNS